MFEEWNHFGEYLKTLRVKRDLKTNEISARLNISQNQYARIENGEINIAENMLPSLAKLLKIHYKELLRVYVYYFAFDQIKNDVFIVPILNSAIQRAGYNTRDNHP